MTDIYRVGISLVAHNGISPILTALGGQMVALQGQATRIGGLFGGWGTALGVVGSILAAGAIAEGLAKIAKEGAKVNKELALMKISGMGSQEIDGSVSVAKAAAGRQLDTDLVGNLKRIRELRAAFGDTEDAEKYLPFVNNARTVLDAMTGNSKVGDQIWELVKSGELKGLTQNPEQFKSLMEGMVKANVMSGGKTTPADFFGAFKYGRSAMYGWDEKFITQFLPTLMQEYKGGGSGGTGGPGNALMSMYAAIVSGTMKKSSAAELEGLGLLTDKNYKPSPGSNLEKGGNGLGVTDTAGFMRNPYQWVQDVLVPALKKKHGGEITQEQLLGDISRIFQVRTAQSIADLMAIQGKTIAGSQSRMEKDAHLQRLSLPGGLEAEAEWLRKNDISTVLEALSKQFSNLGQVLGGPAMAPGGPVVRALASLTEAFGKLGSIAGGPNATAAFGVIGTVVGALFNAGVKLGKFALDLTGVSGVFSALANVPWERLQGAMTSFMSVLSGWVDGIIGIMEKLKSAFGKAMGTPAVDEFGRPFQKSSFNPANTSIKAQPISLSLNVDGRTLAQTISQELEYLYEHATGAPSYDGSRRHIPADGGMMGT